MRSLLAILLLALSAHAAEPPATPTWPLWNGAETVEQYARRAKVEATKTLDLLNGIKMDLVLIPALPARSWQTSASTTPASRWIARSRAAAGRSA